MRLFTALCLTSPVIARLRAAIGDSLPVPKLHITTKFIGEWPEDRVTDLVAALPVNLAAVPVRVRGLKKWACVEETPELLELFHATDTALETLGVPREAKKFTPHITVGKGRFAHSDEDFGHFLANEYHLFESRDSAYIKLATVPLK